MVTQELLGYINKEIEKGKTRDEIQKTLRDNGGWTENDIKEAFVKLDIKGSAFSPATGPNPANVKFDSQKDIKIETNKSSKSNSEYKIPPLFSTIPEASVTPGSVGVVPFNIVDSIVPKMSIPEKSSPEPLSPHLELNNNGTNSPIQNISIISKIPTPIDTEQNTPDGFYASIAKKPSVDSMPAIPKPAPIQAPPAPAVKNITAPLSAGIPSFKAPPAPSQNTTPKFDNMIIPEKKEENLVIDSSYTPAKHSIPFGVHLEPSPYVPSPSLVKPISASAEKNISPKKVSASPILMPNNLSSPERISSNPSPYIPSVSLLKKKQDVPNISPATVSVIKRGLIVFLILCVLGTGLWFGKEPILNFWNGVIGGEQGIFANTWGSITNFFKGISFSHLGSTKAPSSPAQSIATDSMPAEQVKDCGTSTAPNLSTPGTFSNDTVLSCIGASAQICENAKGVLKDDIFPTIVEVVKTKNSCDFRISYAPDSPLVDITGKKLASQSISCPISIVKAIDNTNPASPKFTTPDSTDPGKYGTEIYTYGSIGLFLDNNLDKSKILAAGCSGDYIDTMIASYTSKGAK